MAPVPQIKGKEVLEIAGPNLPPNVRLELQTMIDKLRTNCRDRAVEIASLQRSRVSETKDLRDKLQTVERENRSLTIKLSRSGHDIASLKDKIDGDAPLSRNSEATSLQENLQISERENGELRTGLIRSDRENVSLREENASLREKLDVDGLYGLYQAGTKVIEKQATQIKDLRTQAVLVKEELEKLSVTSEGIIMEKNKVIVQLKEEREKFKLTSERYSREKDEVVVQLKEERKKMLAAERHITEKRQLIVESADVHVVGQLKAQNAELASTANAYKMLNDELNKKITVVQKHFDDRKVLMEDQQKLVKEYQKQLQDVEKNQEA